MVDIIKQQLTKNMSEEEKLNRTREILQITALKIIHDQNLLNNLAFTGGTALRIVFDLRRFSEDMDFSLVKKDNYDFSRIISELIRGFSLYGLEVDAKPKKEGTVNGAFLRFTGLLKELGLSPLASQKLSIKIEVDTNPPQGGVLLNTYINKIYPFTITHFDLPSMFATKLHACFYRKYTKGRDFYDFIWYISKRIKPNYLLLNNAIRQTTGEDPGINAGNFKDFVLKNLDRIDFKIVAADVERFLEDKTELSLFELSPIKSTISSFY